MKCKFKRVTEIYFLSGASGHWILWKMNSMIRVTSLRLCFRYYPMCLNLSQTLSCGLTNWSNHPQSRGFHSKVYSFCKRLNYTDIRMLMKLNLTWKPCITGHCLRINPSFMYKHMYCRCKHGYFLLLALSGPMYYLPWYGSFIPFL